MKKYCKQCEEHKGISKFSKNTKRKDGVNWSCIECERKYSKIWRDKNRNKINKYFKNRRIKLKLENPKLYKENNRKEHLRYVWNLDAEKYLEMLVKQNNVCAGCGVTEIENKKKLAIDHDHTTGNIRGLLCHNCNLILGLCKDNVVILDSLSKYLIKDN